MARTYKTIKQSLDEKYGNETPSRNIANAIDRGLGNTIQHNTIADAKENTPATPAFEITSPVIGSYSSAASSFSFPEEIEDYELVWADSILSDSDSVRIMDDYVVGELIDRYMGMNGETASDYSILYVYDGADDTQIPLNKVKSYSSSATLYNDSNSYGVALSKEQDAETGENIYRGYVGRDVTSYLSDEVIEETQDTVYPVVSVALYLKPFVPVTPEPAS